MVYRNLCRKGPVSIITFLKDREPCFDPGSFQQKLQIDFAKNGIAVNGVCIYGSSPVGDQGMNIPETMCAAIHGSDKGLLEFLVR